jgi:hypothetical protein
VTSYHTADQRAKSMPAHIRRGNATRAKVRSKVEHVFAAQQWFHGVYAVRSYAHSTSKRCSAKTLPVFSSTAETRQLPGMSPRMVIAV